MRFMHFAGLRLGASHPDWPEQGERIRSRQREILIELYELAVQNNAQVMICSGDLFDTRNVPVDEPRFVADLCGRYPGITFVVLPGGRDPWAAYCPHRYLATSGIDNLVVLNTITEDPLEVASGCHLYGLPVDAERKDPPSLRSLERQNDPGCHVAVAYGSQGRLQPGPEQGMVMVAPDIASHPFDYLALSDGGTAERVSAGAHPTCYAAPLVSLDFNEETPGGAWLVDLTSDEARIESHVISIIRTCRIEIEVSGLSDLGAVAQAIRREADPRGLNHVVLKGVRPANRPLLLPNLYALCGGPNTLGLHIVDRTELSEPEINTPTSPALVTRLWESYRSAPPEERQVLHDALALVSAGIQDPSQWREAPWAHS